MNMIDAVTAIHEIEHAAQSEAPSRKSKIMRPAVNFVTRRFIAERESQIINAYLAKLIRSAYETTTDGRFWNMTEYGRLEIAVPWSRRGERQWGTQRQHADLMRRLMFRLQPRSPFVFNDDYRWYVDIEKYPDAMSAMGWIDRVALDAEVVKMLNDA